MMEHHWNAQQNEGQFSFMLEYIIAAGKANNPHLKTKSEGIQAVHLIWNNIHVRSLTSSTTTDFNFN